MILTRVKFLEKCSIGKLVMFIKEEDNTLYVKPVPDGKEKRYADKIIGIATLSCDKDKYGTIEVVSYFKHGLGYIMQTDDIWSLTHLVKNSEIQLHYVGEEYGKD